jgi:predicted house-cleaning noncanonical NTP pyrophosphatase (MazG superfamily)
MIQERFNELNPYLKGIKITNEFTIIEAILKETWKYSSVISLEEGNDDVQVMEATNRKDSEEKGYKYYMIYSSEKSIDELIDILEVIITVNIENEQKQALLRSKVEELKKMFEDKPLDELKSLKFSSDIDVTLNINKPESKKIKETEKTESNVGT